MKADIISTCDPVDWEELPHTKKLALMIKGAEDPIFFWTHPALGNYKPWPSQEKIIKNFYTKDGDKRKYSELIFVSGMRGGKTTIAAMISLYEVFKLLCLDDPALYYNLGPGSEIQCINVAPSEPQALDTVFKRSKELVAHSPFFMSKRHELVYNAIKFPEKNVTIKALGSNSGSGVGRTVKCFIADEVSSFIDNTNHRSAQEVYNRLSKSTATFKPWNENIRVAISSPLYEGDFITTLNHRAKEEKWEWALTYWEPTWNLNPNLNKETLEEERRKDPVSFDRDFGAAPGTEIENLFSPDLMKRIVKDSEINGNVFDDIDNIQPKNDAQYYIIGTDPAVKNDTFGLSIAYVTIDGRVIVEGATRFKAERGHEIDSEEVKKYLIPMFERLPVRYYVFDAYLHGHLKDLAKTYGIETFQHYLNLEDWMKTRDALDKQDATLPNVDFLLDELKYLQLIRGKQVDHPKKFPNGETGTKDTADAVAQIISLVRRTEDLSKSKYSQVPSIFVETF